MSGSNDVGVKFDGGKPKMELISFIALEGLARVLTKGALKYASRNWENGMAWSRPAGALLRHFSLFMQGIDYDIDENCEGCKAGTCTNHTGELHIDQVLCNAMFLSEYTRTRREFDDRPKKKQVIGGTSDT